MREFIEDGILEELIRQTETKPELKTLLSVIEKYKNEATPKLSISDLLLLKTIDKMLDRIERNANDTDTTR